MKVIDYESWKAAERVRALETRIAALERRVAYLDGHIRARLKEEADERKAY